VAKFLKIDAGQRKQHDESTDTLRIESLGVGAAAPGSNGVEIAGTLHAEVVSSNDYAFTDMVCPVCGGALSVGDDVVWRICRQEMLDEEGSRIRSFCVPVHADCRGGA
jgi:hypothetical protein